jgi:hypothetical protein
MSRCRERVSSYKLRAEGSWLNWAGALGSVHSHPKARSSNFDGGWMKLRGWNGRSRACAPREGLETGERITVSAGGGAPWDEELKPAVRAAAVESIVEKLSRYRQTPEKIGPAAPCRAGRKAPNDWPANSWPSLSSLVRHGAASSSTFEAATPPRRGRTE